MPDSFRFKKAPGKHRGVTYLLLFWTIAVLFLVGAFFQERIAFLSDHPTTEMNLAEFYITFSAVIVLTVAYLILVHRNFKIGVSWGWLILFSLLFIANAVGLFTFDSHIAGTSLFKGEEFTYDYTFETSARIQYLCCFLVACVFFYLVFAVIPKTFHNIRRFHFVWHAAIWVAIVMIIYSLIKEWPYYQQSFTPGQKWMVNECTSFTNNPNTFGFVILLAIASLTLLNNRRSHWYWIALMLLLGLYQFLLGSGSATIGSWVIIVFYLVYRWRLTLWSYTGRNVVFGFLFVGGFIALIVCIFGQVGGEGSIFYRLGALMKRDHFSETSGAQRLVTWRRIFATLNTPVKLIFGVGDTQAYYYLGATELPVSEGTIAYAHNGFFHQLLSGGLIRLMVYLALIVRFVYLCFEGIKDKHHFAVAALIAMFGVFVRSFLETTSFLSAEGKGLALYAIFILPIEVSHFLKKHPEVEGYEAEALADASPSRQRYKLTPMRMAKLCFFVMIPLTSVALSTVPMLLGGRGSGYYVLWCTAFLLMPFGYYCLGHHADPSDRGIFSFLLSLGYAVGLGVGVGLEVLFPFAGYIGAGSILLFTLLAYFCHLPSIHSFRERLFVHAYLPSLILTGIMTGLGCLLYLIPMEYASNYNAIAGTIVLFLLYVAILFTPKGEKLAYPLTERLRDFDCRRTAKGIEKERALNRAQEDYLYKGIHRTPPPSKKYTIRF